MKRLNLGSKILSASIYSVLNLPYGLKTLEAEAFAGISAEVVVVPSGCTSIGSRAFANCRKLKQVIIPASVKTVASDAFEGCSSDLIIERQ